MNLSKFITGIRRFLTGLFLVPFFLFSFFLSFSFMFPETKVIILQNEGYYSLLNSIIGIAGLMITYKSQKYFEEYKKWKEEALYQKQLKKGIDDRYTEELSAVRREDYLDFYEEKK